MNLPPSIFNDVIGPVMRGPSSSHCAAALRIGRLVRDLMGGAISHILVEFHRTGSLATTHATQGSDMGLFGGLMGWEATDARLVGSRNALEEAGAEIEIRVSDFSAPHPNTYRMTVSGGGSRHRVTAISTGGGMVEVLEVDGIPMDLKGDAYELLIWVAPGAEDSLLEKEVLRALASEADVPEWLTAVEDSGQPAGTILRIRKLEPLPSEILDSLAGLNEVKEVRLLAPVLPVLTPRQVQVPFLSPQRLLEFNRSRGLTLWELAVEYEKARGGLSGEEVLTRMEDIVELLEGSVREGLAGTEFRDRILGAQSPGYRVAMESGRLLEAGALDQIILQVSALMEVKSAMGVIVAAPTAGACGAVPGACLGAGTAMGLDRIQVARGMLAAGLVGIFIAAESTFAAEVCGCQAETGAGGGMAAAALVTMAGGTAEQALAAASMALQNTMGLTCDPVANRVEVPCLGRNVLAASNALSSANLALAGFDPVIPLDEVIRTMDAVGKSLPRELRCTALGGLSVTPTSLRVAKELEERG